MRRTSKIVALAVGVILAGVSGAQALPIFTFNPAGAGLTGTAFSADNIILSDFATIVLTPSGSGATFTNNGVLPVVGFQVGSSSVATPGLNSTYGLYFQFAATGTQNTPVFGPTTTGVFNSLNYSLFGYNVTGAVSYLPGNVTPTGVLAPILLGSGSLIAGGVGATVIPGVGAVPNANTLLTFTPVVPAFFVSPVPFYDADFAAFTNNPSQIITTSTGFIISQGGGSANFLLQPVPEPISLAVYGVGVAATLLLRRRARAV